MLSRDGFGQAAGGIQRAKRVGRLALAWIGLGALASSVLPGGAIAGSVYRYMDADGVTHFSDAPRDNRYSRVRIHRQEGLVIAPRSRVKVPTERDYDRLIAQFARQHGVPAGLVKAVIAAESNFQPKAVSRVGAQGLMQLMPATAAELGVERPFGVVENIDGGVRYLRLMFDRYQDVTLALAAYNAGPAAVDRYGGVPPYRETQAYVKRVLEYYRSYRPDFEPRHAPRVREGAVASADPAAQIRREGRGSTLDATLAAD